MQALPAVAGPVQDQGGRAAIAARPLVCGGPGPPRLRLEPSWPQALQASSGTGAACLARLPCVSEERTFRRSSTRGPLGEALLRRLDRANIFLIIAGTCTPPGRAPPPVRAAVRAAVDRLDKSVGRHRVPGPAARSSALAVHPVLPGPGLGAGKLPSRLPAHRRSTAPPSPSPPTDHAGFGLAPLVTHVGVLIHDGRGRPLSVPLLEVVRRPVCSAGDPDTHLPLPTLCGVLSWFAVCTLQRHTL